MKCKTEVNTYFLLNKFVNILTLPCVKLVNRRKIANDYDMFVSRACLRKVQGAALRRKFAAAAR
jgi:hypothetical protein